MNAGTGRVSIPITVVAGYLGAGKTTAIVGLLSSPQTERIGLIVNDFGEIGVDAALLGDGVIGFDNGCVCCTAKDGLGPALATLREAGVDRIVIEASGVADPGPLANWGNLPGHLPGGVVVCADATSVLLRLRDRWVGDTVARQLAAADVVLLTHADLISADVLEGVSFVVRSRSPRASVRVGTSAVGLAEILHSMEAAHRRPAPEGAHAEHEARTMRLPGEIGEADLRSALGAVPETVHRAKGFLHVAGLGMCTVQVAGSRTAITPAPDGIDQADIGALVVIVRPGTADPPSLIAAGFAPHADPFPAKGLRHAHAH